MNTNCLECGVAMCKLSHMMVSHWMQHHYKPTGEEASAEEIKHQKKSNDAMKKEIGDNLKGCDGKSVAGRVTIKEDKKVFVNAKNDSNMPDIAPRVAEKKRRASKIPHFDCEICGESIDGLEAGAAHFMQHERQSEIPEGEGESAKNIQNHSQNNEENLKRAGAHGSDVYGEKENKAEIIVPLPTIIPPLKTKTFPSYSSTSQISKRMSASQTVKQQHTPPQPEKNGNKEKGKSQMKISIKKLRVALTKIQPQNEMIDQTEEMTKFTTNKSQTNHSTKMARTHSKGYEIPSKSTENASHHKLREMDRSSNGKIVGEQICVAGTRTSRGSTSSDESPSSVSLQPKEISPSPDQPEEESISKNGSNSSPPSNGGNFVNSNIENDNFYDEEDDVIVISDSENYSETLTNSYSKAEMLAQCRRLANSKEETEIITPTKMKILSVKSLSSVRPHSESCNRSEQNILGSPSTSQNLSSQSTSLTNFSAVNSRGNSPQSDSTACHNSEASSAVRNLKNTSYSDAESSIYQQANSYYVKSPVIDRGNRHHSSDRMKLRDKFESVDPSRSHRAAFLPTSDSLEEFDRHDKGESSMSAAELVKTRKRNSNMKEDSREQCTNPPKHRKRKKKKFRLLSASSSQSDEATLETSEEVLPKPRKGTARKTLLLPRKPVSFSPPSGETLQRCMFCSLIIPQDQKATLDHAKECAGITNV